MVERHCRLAAQFAEELRRAGYEVLNQVILNQVLVSFGESELNREIIRAIQKDGTCWCGATKWQGETVMRISISSWVTGEEDIDRSLAAVLRIAKTVGSSRRT
jgi:threonine aldolase